MTRLVVHIGLEKTGSTYLQDFLLENVDHLAAAGVAYPDFCALPEHLEVYMAALPGVRWMHRRKGIDTPEKLAELKAQVHRGLTRMAEQDGDVAVVTCEQLSYFDWDAALTGLRELCAEHFDQVDVVAFLRRPDHAVGSYYGQAVKAGMSSRSVPEFMARHGRMLDHAAIMGDWQRVFGADRVFAWPYVERYRTSGDEALGVVLRHLGVDPPTPAEPGPWRRPTPGTNARLSAEATEYMRLLNPLVPRWCEDGTWNGTQRGILRRELSTRFPGPNAEAGKDLVDEVIAAYPAAATAAEWRRPGSPDAALWDEWLAQPPASGGEPPVLSEAEVEAVRAELFVPRGELIPGGRKPERGGVTGGLKRYARSLRRRLSSLRPS